MNPAPDRVSTTRILVVGLGAVGSATLYQLALRGIACHGIDAHYPPHALGSSHGQTRITRLAVGEGAAYVPLVQRSHAIWRSLESQAQTRLLHTCGGLVFGGRHERLQAHGSADFLQTTCDVASQHRIQHERLDAHQMQSRFPAFCFEGDEEGYYEPEAGYVMPERCIEVQLGEAKRLGAAITTGCRMTGWHSTKGGYRVETAEGAFDCETLILCTGPWVVDALPTLQGHATPYRQVLHWFEPEGPTEWFEPGTMPVFIRVPYRGHEMIYGFPEVKGPGSGLKVATESFNRSCHPEAMDREVLPSESEAMARITRTHLRIGKRCLHSVVCPYTVTPDFGFLIDRHPVARDVWVASPCSGHGFKHSAAVGEILAEVSIGQPSPMDLSAFAWRF